MRRARSSVQRRKQVVGAIVEGVMTAGRRGTLPPHRVEWKRHACAQTVAVWMWGLCVSAAARMKSFERT